MWSHCHAYHCQLWWEPEKALRRILRNDGLLDLRPPEWDNIGCNCVCLGSGDDLKVRLLSEIAEGCVYSTVAGERNGSGKCIGEDKLS